ncbi:MAG: hypothetical protein S0880_12470 [Actinomycetota bacterium]|nr:hypothetical protein [Actinomycetota bacterium]
MSHRVRALALALLCSSAVLVSCGRDERVLAPLEESVRSDATVVLTELPSTSAPTTAPSTTTTAPTTTAPTTTVAPTTTTAAPTTTAVPPPPPTLPPSGSMFVLGDSVLLGAAHAVPNAFPGWAVTYDALQNRRLTQGIEVLQQRRSEIGQVAVVMLGNNFIPNEQGKTYATQIDEAMSLLADVPLVVWLTVAEIDANRTQINQAIRDARPRWPNLVVADWSTIAAGHPEWTANDQLHLGTSGTHAIAALIAKTVAARFDRGA